MAHFSFSPDFMEDHDNFDFGPPPPVVGPEVVHHSARPEDSEWAHIMDEALKTGVDLPPVVNASSENLAPLVSETELGGGGPDFNTGCAPNASDQPQRTPTPAFLQAFEAQQQQAPQPVNNKASPQCPGQQTMLAAQVQAQQQLFNNRASPQHPGQQTSQQLPAQQQQMWQPTHNQASQQFQGQQHPTWQQFNKQASPQYPVHQTTLHASQQLPAQQQQMWQTTHNQASSVHQTTLQASQQFRAQQQQRRLPLPNQASPQYSAQQMQATPQFQAQQQRVQAVHHRANQQDRILRVQSNHPRAPTVLGVAGRGTKKTIARGRQAAAPRALEGLSFDELAQLHIEIVECVRRRRMETQEAVALGFN